MTHINEKLGLRAGGKRAMMKLPSDHTLRSQLTAAICPACRQRYARLSHVQPDAFWCAWCSHTWTPKPVAG
jgi:hypothetical protein